MMRHVLAAALMAAQPFPGVGSSGGTGPVSLSVLATSMCVVDTSGRGTLELLILWRGSQGWYRKSGGGGSGSGGGGSMGPGNTRMIRNEWISQGGVNLTVRFDPAVRKVWIQDREIALDDANVVLVDGVDSPAGPQVVRTLRIDPEYQTMPRGPVPSETFIRRSPELIDFLQCDVTVAGLSTYEQQMFDLLCMRVTQP